MSAAEGQAKARRVHGYQPISVSRLTRVEIGALLKLLQGESTDVAVREAVVHYRRHLVALQSEVAHLVTQVTAPPSTTTGLSRKPARHGDQANLKMSDKPEQDDLFSMASSKPLA